MDNVDEVPLLDAGEALRRSAVSSGPMDHAPILKLSTAISALLTPLLVTLWSRAFPPRSLGIERSAASLRRRNSWIDVVGAGFMFAGYQRLHIINIAGRAKLTKRISRIAPWSAGRLFAVIYFFLSLLFVIPMALIWTIAPIPAASKPPFGPGMLVIFPFLYAGAGLLFVALACAIYNLAAKFVGGVEISVVDVPEA
jgi:hypothetical protein